MSSRGRASKPKVMLRAKPKPKSNVRRAPTERKGATAKADLVKQVVLFSGGSKRVTLPYYEQKLSRTGTAGAITNYLFSANGCYDPNITSTGHQPMGFDTMMTYYEQFTVMASKITVCFVSNGNNAFRAGIALSPDTTGAVTGDVVENGLIKFVVLDSPYVPSISPGGGGARCKEVSLNCNCASYFGRKTLREMLNDTTLAGNAASNPTEQVYYDIVTWGAFYSDDTNCVFDVVIEYDVIFWEPRKVAQQ